MKKSSWALVLMGVTALLLAYYFIGRSELAVYEAAASAESVKEFDARVLTKRTSTRGSRKSVTSTYFVTFESAAGRRELQVADEVYGLLAEGDQGTLYSKGAFLDRFDLEGGKTMKGQLLETEILRNRIGIYLVLGLVGGMEIFLLAAFFILRSKGS